VLSQFQGCNGCNSEHDAHDPESRDDFSFGIILFLVMVMKWAHQEDALAFTKFFLSVFEITYLDDYA
jgi:hypothetical protein